MRYRKKPVVVEALQFTRDIAWVCLSEHTPFWDQFTVAGSWNEKTHELHYAYIVIETLEGRMRANLNDWVIKGVKGEFYPCKPDIFETTYEPAP